MKIYQGRGGQWFLTDYGSGNWYIGEVMALGQSPEPAPEPAGLII